MVLGPSGSLNGNGGTLISNVENRGVVAVDASPGTIVVKGDFVQSADGRSAMDTS